VPEGKTAKNRLHLDLGPTDATRDDAVERALTAGASVLADHRREDGTGWVTLADPEGNEFCIERGDLERPVTSQTYRLGS
jgi:predicted enzyme related to lactoylglutathione lyase